MAVKVVLRLHHGGIHHRHHRSLGGQDTLPVVDRVAVVAVVDDVDEVAVDVDVADAAVVVVADNVVVVADDAVLFGDVFPAS